MQHTNRGTVPKQTIVNLLKLQHNLSNDEQNVVYCLRFKILLQNYLILVRTERVAKIEML